MSRKKIESFRKELEELWLQRPSALRNTGMNMIYILLSWSFTLTFTLLAIFKAEALSLIGIDLEHDTGMFLSGLFTGMAILFLVLPGFMRKINRRNSYILYLENRAHEWLNELEK